MSVDVFDDPAVFAGSFLEFVSSAVAVFCILRILAEERFAVIRADCVCRVVEAAGCSRADQAE